MSTPADTSTPPAAAAGPAAAGPAAPRVPLVDRLAELADRAAALEEALNELIARHNTFAQDVSRELGL